MLKVRLFRAIDDLESCKRFSEGHAQILKEFGVSKVTSANNDWFYNPGVYVLDVFFDDEPEPVAGVRIHIANENPMPMQKAIEMVDTRINDLVDLLKTKGHVAELCGLWNAKKMAGQGIASYILMRAGISVAPLLNIKTMMALCAQHTYQISIDKGFETEISVGNSGAFNYPKLDLVATAIVIKDVINLPLAKFDERILIEELRINPNLQRFEHTSKIDLNVQYDLNL